MDNMYMEKRPRAGAFGIYYVKLMKWEFLFSNEDVWVILKKSRFWLH